MPVTIVEYDPRWPQMFAAEKELILGAIGDYLVAIEHIGSTAVPGLTAKPIIDIMAAFRLLADAEHCIEPLTRIGYHYVPEYEAYIPERRYFRKGQPRTHHLHMVEPTSDFWRRHLLFRDYLRRHSDTAKEYEQLKHGLASDYGSDRFAYTEAKTEFIESVLAQATRELANG